MIDGVTVDVAGISAVIGAAAVILTWVQYQSGGTAAYERESIMRARFEEKSNERDLWPARTLVVFPPRVRTWGFRRWLWSLLPFTKSARYTQLDFRVRYPNEQHGDFDTSEVNPDTPDPDELAANEKLAELDVFHVEYSNHPEKPPDTDPTTDYRLFIDSINPDRVGGVIDILHLVIEEIQSNDTVVELVDAPMRPSEFKTSRNE